LSAKSCWLVTQFKTRLWNQQKWSTGPDYNISRLPWRTARACNANSSVNIQERTKGKLINTYSKTNVASCYSF
jgi:hypothetical protein